jgi:hypothetical protein
MPFLLSTECDGEEGNLLGRQPFQWGREKRRVQKIAVDVVEAEIVDGDIGLAGRSRAVPFKCERMCFASSVEEPRADIAKIEK